MVDDFSTQHTVFPLAAHTDVLRLAVKPTTINPTEFMDFVWLDFAYAILWALFVEKSKYNE